MKPPAFQFYAAEYLADEHVQLMTLEEEGAYIRLLAFCWREGSIPKAIGALSRLCKGASTTVLTTVLKRFKPTDNGERLVHPRLDAERKKQQDWREKSAQGGRASAHKRKKPKEPRAEQGGSTKAQPTASTKGQAASLNTSSSSASSSSSSTTVDKPKDTSLADARTVFDFWRSHLDHPNARFDNKRERYIRARLKEGFSVDDLQRAIRGCKASPYHMGQNDSHTIFDRIDLIFRDTEHVELFIAKVPGANGTKPKIVESAEAKAIRESCLRCFGTGTERTEKGARVCKHEVNDATGIIHSGSESVQGSSANRSESVS